MRLARNRAGDQGYRSGDGRHSLFNAETVQQGTAAQVNRSGERHPYVITNRARRGFSVLEGRDAGGGRDGNGREGRAASAVEDRAHEDQRGESGSAMRVIPTVDNHCGQVFD